MRFAWELFWGLCFWALAIGAWFVVIHFIMKYW